MSASRLGRAARLFGAICWSMALGCSCLETDIVQDQAYFEELMYSMAHYYDIVHGTPHIAIICEHDAELDCPDGRMADPVTIEIDADWMPEQARLDRSLPIMSSESVEPEMGISGYIRIGRFMGLPFNPGANVVCDGEPAVEGWRNIVGFIIYDRQLETRGIEHEGLHQAIERGVADSTEPVTGSGGFSQLDCGGPAE